MIDRARHTGRSGNALVLAVLLLLAMTSVGLVSVQRTNSDLQVAANVVRAAQAQTAGEAGTNHAMAYIRNFLFSKIAGWRQSGVDQPVLPIMERSTALTTDDASNIPFVLPATGSAAEKDAAFGAQSVAYSVEGRGVGEKKDMAGFSVGKVCFQVFNYEAKGGMPTAVGQTVDDTMLHSDTVVVRYRTQAVVGPSQCLIR